MKVIVVVLLSLLASQQVFTEYRDDSARGLKDKFVDIIKGIMSLIQSTLTSILSEVEKAIGKIGDILKGALKLVDNTINKILDVINDLEKKALDLGIDIAECVVENKKLILDLKNKTIDKLHKTADRTLEGFNDIKNEAVSTIQGYTEMVNTLLDEFLKCSIINLICMGKVLAKATATSIELTIQLPLVAARMIKTIGVVVIKGTADITSITNDFTTTSTKMLLEVTTCVAEKMPI